MSVSIKANFWRESRRALGIKWYIPGLTNKCNLMAKFVLFGGQSLDSDSSLIPDGSCDQKSTFKDSVNFYELSPSSKFVDFFLKEI